MSRLFLAAARNNFPQLCLLQTSERGIFNLTMDQYKFIGPSDGLQNRQKDGKAFPAQKRQRKIQSFRR